MAGSLTAGPVGSILKGGREAMAAALIGEASDGERTRRSSGMVGMEKGERGGQGGCQNVAWVVRTATHASSQRCCSSGGRRRREFLHQLAQVSMGGGAGDL